MWEVFTKVNLENNYITDDGMEGIVVLAAVPYGLRTPITSHKTLHVGQPPVSRNVRFRHTETLIPFETQMPSFEGYINKAKRFECEFCCGTD